MYKNNMHCTSIWSKSLPGVATRTLIPFLILKRNTVPHAFTCTFTYSIIDYWRSVHITPEKIKNAALPLRLSPPYTLIRHESGTFRKRTSNRRKLKNSAFCFRVEGKHFENRTFRKWWLHDNHVISPAEFSSNTNPKWPVIVAFSNSSGANWTEHIWCAFRVKPPISESSGVVWTPAWSFSERKLHCNQHKVTVW